MTNLEFIKAIESNFKHELLGEDECFILFLDDFSGDFIVSLNANDTFNISIAIYDEFHEMHGTVIKHQDVFTLAYYKSVVSALESVLNNFELSKTQKYDCTRKFICTIDCCCGAFSIELFNSICEALTNAINKIGGFCGRIYEQALVEVIANDDDYPEIGDFSLKDNRLMSKTGRSMIFAGDVSGAFPNIHLEEFLEVDDIYIGQNHAIVKNNKNNKMVASNSQYVKLFLQISEEYEIADIKYISDFSHFVCVVSENLRFLDVVYWDINRAISNEYELLVSQLTAMKRFATVNTCYDFSHLTEDDFEMLCFDLLYRKGFQSVKRVGKTNAPDGGVDIIAYKEQQTLVSIERQKFIVQCKHSKKSLDRKDVAEISDLMTEHDAQSYILFCSNSFTPQAVSRLEHKKTRGNINIDYFGEAEISFEIEKHPDLITKYKLLNIIDS